jgi:NADPH-dependent curcumin reductase CurA
MRVAAVTRTLMAEASSLPITHYELGRPLEGAALGEVVAAPGTALKPQDLVLHNLGWREFALVDEAKVRRVDQDMWPDPAASLSQGFAGWLAVTQGAEISPGDTVLINGAAGGVGCIAGQFARLRGAGRVIGTAGSRWKADRLVADLGFDSIAVRDEGGIEAQLRAAAPGGVDVCVDTVGGQQLTSALAVARRKAHFVLLGSMANQASGGTRGDATIDSLAMASGSITMSGLTTHDHRPLEPEWEAEFSQGLRAGTLRFPHSRLAGIEQAPRALVELLEGQHMGTVLVDLAP